MRARDVDRLLIEVRAAAFSNALDPADALRRIRDAFRSPESGEWDEDDQ